MSGSKPQGCFAMSAGIIGIIVENKDAAKHPTMHRMAADDKEWTGPNVSSAEVKPWCRWEFQWEFQ